MRAQGMITARAAWIWVAMAYGMKEKPGSEVGMMAWRIKTMRNVDAAMRLRVCQQVTSLKFHESDLQESQ